MGIGIILIIGSDLVRSQETIQSDTAVSALGTGFTYQGQLQLNGDPVNDTCDFRFDLWDAASMGNQIGGLDQANSTDVIDGRFTLTLNAGNEFGDDAFRGDARWLRVRVRCPAGSGSYTTLTPRQPLQPAPYALSVRPGATISGTVTAGTGALNVRSDWYGLRVTNAGSHGVLVNHAEGNGLYVGRALRDGLRIDFTGSAGFGNLSSENNGVEIAGVEGKGIYMGQIGTDGIFINDASGDGIVVNNAGNPSTNTSSSFNNGVEIGGTGGDGIFLGRADRDGVRVDTIGLDGFQANQVEDNGVEINSYSGMDLAGYFNGDVQITGTCSGCRVATFGINLGETTLESGDVVTVRGTRTDQALVGTTPALMEVDQAQEGATVIGVVVGRAELDTGDGADDRTTPHLVPRTGPAKPGAYVTIVTHGPMQVKASSIGSIEAGMRLTAAGNGAVRALQTTTVNGVMVAEFASTVGIALENGTTAAEGLLWVFVNPQ
jgi:hypothetical protein